jgi:hypothetical protein
MLNLETPPSAETCLQADDLFELLDEAGSMAELLLQADDLPFSLRREIEDIATRTHLSALRVSLWQRRLRWTGQA